MILIADDDLSIARFLQRALEAEGYNVLTARDGREALELAEQHQPDLVLSDIRMPRMDGYGLLRALTERDSAWRPKVILTSAYESPPVDSADAFIPKPFDLTDLLNTVNDLLQSR